MVEEKQEGGVFCPHPPGKIGLKVHSFSSNIPKGYQASLEDSNKIHSQSSSQN